MIEFNHRNVMTLVGASLDGNTPLLIMPFMANGSLLSFVRNDRDDLCVATDDEASKVYCVCFYIS